MKEKQTNEVACGQNERRANTVTRTIGGTVYRLKIGFCENAKETMEDKIIRMVRNEATSTKTQTRHPA